MAKPKNPPIYYAFEKLYDRVVVSTRKAPRDLGWGLVKDLRRDVQAIGVSIRAANRRTGAARVERLDLLAEQIDAAEIMLMKAIDTRCMTREAGADAMHHVDELARQCAGWSRHTRETPITSAARSAPST